MNKVKVTYLRTRDNGTKIYRIEGSKEAIAAYIKAKGDFGPQSTETRTDGSSTGNALYFTKANIDCSKTYVLNGTTLERPVSARSQGVRNVLGDFDDLVVKNQSPLEQLAQLSAAGLVKTEGVAVNITASNGVVAEGDDTPDPEENEGAKEDAKGSKKEKATAENLA